MGYAFLGQLLQRLLEFLGLHGIRQTDAAQNFRREVGNADKVQILAFGQGVADAQRPVIGYANHITGVGFLGQRPILGEEKLRRAQAHRLSRFVSA